MDDARLREQLDLLRQGDRNAFETIYHDIKTPVFTIILRITQDRELSEDLLQEFFVKLFRAPPDPTVRKPRAYLFQTARNMALDGLRKRPREDSLDECGHLPADGLDRREDAVDLDAAFCRLPLTERQIVVLHINGGLKFREIAEGLGQPIGTVLWRYQKALGALRSCLEGDAL